MNALSKAGVALMIAAFAVLTFFIILPSIVPIDTTPWLHGPYQAAFCHGDETLSSDSQTYRPSPGETDTTVTTACTDPQGNARDVSGDIIKVGMIGYLAPFLIGLAMWQVASNRKKAMASGVTYSVDNFGERQGSIHLASHDKVASVSGETLERLRTLKTAYAQGLITQSEYEAKREELLKGM